MPDVRERAGLEDVRLHNLLHSCGSCALALGESAGNGLPKRIFRTFFSAFFAGVTPGREPSSFRPFDRRGFRAGSMAERRPRGFTVSRPTSGCVSKVVEIGFGASPSGLSFAAVRPRGRGFRRRLADRGFPIHRLCASGFGRKRGAPRGASALFRDTAARSVF